MKNPIQIAFFDVDGTIRVPSNLISDTVLRGIQYLQSKKIMTTIASAFTYSRFITVFKDQYESLISKDTLLVLENGARITDYFGKHIQYYPLQKIEIDLIIDSISNDQVEMVGYYPYSITERTTLWISDRNKKSEIEARYSSFADIFTGSLKDLKQKIIKDNPCMIMIKPTTTEFITLLPTELNSTINEKFVHIITKGRNKAIGITDVLAKLQLSLDEVLIAGNDHNDYDMLKLPCQKKIIVGNTLSDVSLPKDEFTFLSTPDDLGMFLQSL